MNDNKYNFSKRAKLYLCCSDDCFRPVMNNIYFDEGYAIATDGHILVRARLSEISNLSPEDIEKLNGKLLNAASYKELLKYPDICITDTAIEAKRPISTYGTMKASFEFTEDSKFLNYKSVLDNICVPEEEEEQVPKIFTTGLNVNSLKKLTDSLSVDCVDLRYTSRHKAVEVIFNTVRFPDTRAIIMPRTPQCENL